MPEEGLAQSSDQPSMSATVGPAPTPMEPSETDAGAREGESAEEAVAAPEVEPLLDLAGFAAIEGLRLTEQAALRSWISRQPPAVLKHQTLADWRAFRQQMLGHH